MTLGTEWLIDASGCDPTALADLDRLREIFDRVIRDLGLNVLGEIAWHQFDQPTRRQRPRTTFRIASHLPHVSRISRRDFQSLLLSQSRLMVLGNNAQRNARRHAKSTFACLNE